MRLKRTLLSLSRKQEGATLVEAAFVLPIFILMTLMFFEITIIFFYSFILENAMYEATRSAKIADFRGNISENVRTLIGESSYGIMPADKVIITTDLSVNTNGDFSNNGPEFCVDNTTCPCGDKPFQDLNNNDKCDEGPPPLELGDAGDTISYIAFYKKKILTPMLAPILGYPDGEVIIASVTALRNEP